MAARTAAHSAAPATPPAVFSIMSSMSAARGMNSCASSTASETAAQKRAVPGIFLPKAAAKNAPSGTNTAMFPSMLTMKKRLSAAVPVFFSLRSDRSGMRLRYSPSVRSFGTKKDGLPSTVSVCDRMTVSETPNSHRKTSCDAVSRTVREATAPVRFRRPVM